MTNFPQGTLYPPPPLDPVRDEGNPKGHTPESSLLPFPPTIRDSLPFVPKDPIQKKRFLLQEQTILEVKYKYFTLMGGWVKTCFSKKNYHFSWQSGRAQIRI